MYYQGAYFAYTYLNMDLPSALIYLSCTSILPQTHCQLATDIYFSTYIYLIIIVVIFSCCALLNNSATISRQGHTNCLVSAVKYADYQTAAVVLQIPCLFSFTHSHLSLISLILNWFWYSRLYNTIHDIYIIYIYIYII